MDAFEKLFKHLEQCKSTLSKDDQKELIKIFGSEEKMHKFCDIFKIPRDMR